MIKANSKNLIKLINNFKNDKEAVKFFIQQRWNGKVKCPYKTCKSNEFETENKIYEIATGYKCSCCNKKFSYKTGTIFENTKIEMKAWFTAIYLHISNKKGISSCQLARHIGCTQKTAWFMLMRIRYALENNSFDSFEGVNEIDEVYLGGVSENKHMKERIALKEKDNKMAVVGITNRETGKTTLNKVESAEYHNLADVILNKVKVGSTIITDGLNAYKRLNNFYTHKSVNHSEGEYVKYEKEEGKKAFKVHTNSIEGLFGHVRRTIEGTYHFISEKHCQKYLNEISHRFSTRKIADFDRFFDYVKKLERRLTYKELILR